jgi:hypothetical protein
MPIPVIADVFRCTLDWTGTSPMTPVNVFHIECPGGNESDVAAGIEASWVGSMFDQVSSAFAFSFVSIMPLDGVSPATPFPVTSHTGGAGGQPIPNQAQVLSIKTSQKGPRGRGRLYLGPITEDNVTGGYMVAATNNTIAAAWQTFANNLIANSPTMSLGVASYVHADFHQASIIGSGPKAGSQRRRLRRA